MYSLVRLISVACFALLLFGKAGVQAQELDNVEERLRPLEEAERAARDAKTPFPETPALHSKDDYEQGKLDRFVLVAVDIKGATAIPLKEFAPLYDKLLTTNVTISDVAALAENITALYRKRGYFLSRAIIPAQDARDGMLKIRIVEGYIAEVNVEGAGAAQIKDRLSRLTKEKPLRISTLERELALIGDLNGVNITAAKIDAFPSEHGRHRLRVNIVKDTFSGSIYADNRGTKDAGPVQTYVSGAANSALFFGDQLSGGVFFTPFDPDELLLGQAAYSVPIGSHGTELRVSGMVSTFDAGGPRASTETESRTHRLIVGISHPVIRLRRTTLWAGVGFEGRNLEQEAFGTTQFLDKIRSVYASLTLRKALWNGVTGITVKATQGLDMLGASTGGNLSRSDANGRYTKFNAEVNRLQKLGMKFSAYVSVAGQLSLDPLLSPEEFSLGGSRYGRAFDYGEYKGDDGFAASVELRYDPGFSVGLLKNLQIYGYHDYGAVWNDNVAAEFAKRDLSSAGVGVRLLLREKIRLNGEITKPVDGTPYFQGDKSWRGFFSISKQF